MTDTLSDTRHAARPAKVVLSRDLEASPEKVWRALRTPALRARWLPEDDLADTEPVVAAPGEELRYRMRDREPPFLESVVTFLVRPNTDGGTRLTIIHRLTDARLAAPAPRAANANGRELLSAA